MRESSARLPLILVLTVLCAVALGCQAGRIHPDRALPRLPQIEQRLDAAIDGLPNTPRLLVGASKVDISPYGMRVWIAGFGPGRISRGMRDPIWARALYIDDGRNAVVFLTLDVVGLLNPDVQRIRELAAPEHGQAIMVMSTHNHQGPDTMGVWGPGLLIPLATGIEPEYQQRLLSLAATAVDRAVRDARPATLRFGRSEVDPGWAVNLWFPDDPTKLDRELVVLQALDQQGQAIATLFNWAMHAETLFQWNSRISADFPGRAYDAIEQRHGGVALFVSNAAGGMVIPYPNRWDKRKQFDLEAREKWLDELASMLADKVDQGLQSGSAAGPEEVAIERLDEQIWLPVDNSLYRMLNRNGLLKLDGRPLRGDPPETIGSEVHAIRLGPATIACVPGEPFPSIGRELKQSMNSEYRLVFTLANDELGYMMLPAEFADPTYKYEHSESLSPDAGVLTLQALQGLLERLH